MVRDGVFYMLPQECKAQAKHDWLDACERGESPALLEKR